jgi:hypothetical protein
LFPLFATDVIDTGGKFTAGFVHTVSGVSVSVTSDTIEFATGINDTIGISGKFTAGAVHTSGKFAVGFVDTGGAP